MSCLGIALAYRENDWSIIPIAKDKTPLLRLWKEFQTRIASEEEIREWWRLYPDAQIGIVTGKISNLTVIDVEKDGDFNFVKDKTLVIKTGGGGRHYYFEYD